VLVGSTGEVRKVLRGHVGTMQILNVMGGGAEGNNLVNYRPEEDLLEDFITASFLHYCETCVRLFCFTNPRVFILQ
jgi:hypothetical protein